MLETVAAKPDVLVPELSRLTPYATGTILVLIPQSDWLVLETVALLLGILPGTPAKSDRFVELATVALIQQFFVLNRQ